MTAGRATGRPRRGGSTPSSVALVGGRPCLDFVNTVSWRGTRRPRDLLRSGHDLAIWARRAGLLSSPRAEALGRWAARRPATSARAMGRVRRLRETLHALFVAVAAGRRPPRGPVAALRAEWRRLVARRELVARPGGLTWREPAEPVDRVLAPLLASAVALLAGDEVGQVRRCDGPGCGWLFLDASRSRARRWCSMRDCGNREKARRAYARRRTAARSLRTWQSG